MLAYATIAIVKQPKGEDKHSATMKQTAPWLNAAGAASAERARAALVRKDADQKLKQFKDAREWVPPGPKPQLLLDSDAAMQSPSAYLQW